MGGDEELQLGPNKGRGHLTMPHTPGKHTLPERGSSDRPRMSPVMDRLKEVDPFAATMQHRRSSSIYYAGDPAEYWYLLTSGMAARSAVLADGRRQIVELLFPGDFFGFSAHGSHQSTVEALSDETTIVRYSRRSVEAAMEADSRLASYVRQLAFEAILRLDRHVLKVGRMTAVEKVGAFLIEMEDRIPLAGERIALPISRYDIADYLGLSMETVSRAMAELERKEAISLCGPHRVKVLNRDVLCPD